jgi:hypothetical protein
MSGVHFLAMSILVQLLDLAVLVLLIVYMLRAVGRFGSAALTALVGFFVILFSIVSLGAFSSEASIATQLVFLVALAVVASIVISSSKPDGKPS